MHERIESRYSEQMGTTDKNAPFTIDASLRDIELAKRKLAAEALSVVVVKLGKTMFTSRAPGVKSLIEAIREFGPSLAGASIADKVVGKAAALLCVYTKASRVYGCVMSALGSDVLKNFFIPFEHDTLVPNILDRHGTGMCPFEKLVLGINSPEEAFSAIDRYLATKA